MSSSAAGRVFGKHGGYRELKAYQVAELLYDFTCRFCERYIPTTDRHHDQMVQAARSGYQNIAEGSEDSATSRKLELNLTNVSKGSIGELLRDYGKHLKRRRLRRWEPGEARFEAARALRPQTLEEAAAWVNAPGRREAAEERAANLGAILAAQAHYLVERLLDRQALAFEAEGGFAERLYRARAAGRGRTAEADQTDHTDSRGGGRPVSPGPIRQPRSVSSVSSVPSGLRSRTDQPDSAAKEEGGSR
jgi:four helix bundle suffix protein